MRILHFSDPHLPPRLRSVPLADWLGKRITGAANLFLRRRRQFRSVRYKLEKLSQFVREQSVDFILCTGDYTLFGTDPELRDARRAVQPLVDASRGFVTVPGNHDLYTHSVVREKRFFRHFGDLMQGDDTELDFAGRWPIVRGLDDAAVAIALNSSRPHRLPWRSSGHISRGELEALNDLLETSRVRDRFVFVMTHHAPVLANGRRDRRHRRLHNADELIAVGSRIERGAVLFGHVHHCYRLTLPGLRAPLFNAGSATMSLHEGLWVFDVEDSTVRVHRGRWSGDHYSLEPSEPILAE